MKVTNAGLQNDAETQDVSFETIFNGTAKAWTCLDGTGTISGLNDFNVSSYTDNGTGDYDIHLTNSFSDADYCQTACANNDISRQKGTGQDASTMRVETAVYTSAPTDDGHAMAAGFGELA